MHHEPWLVTFRLLDGAGTRHSYVVKDDVTGSEARQRAFQLAESAPEKAARGGVRIDPGHIDVLEITEAVKARTLRFDLT